MELENLYNGIRNHCKQNENFITELDQKVLNYHEEIKLLTYKKVKTLAELKSGKELLNSIGSKLANQSDYDFKYDIEDEDYGGKGSGQESEQNLYHDHDLYQDQDQELEGITEEKIDFKKLFQDMYELEQKEKEKNPKKVFPRELRLKMMPLWKFINKKRMWQYNNWKYKQNAKRKQNEKKTD